MKTAQIHKALIYASKMLNFQAEKLLKEGTEGTEVFITAVHYMTHFDMEQEHLNYHFA